MYFQTGNSSQILLTLASEKQLGSRFICGGSEWRARPRPIPGREVGVGKDGSLPTVDICFSILGPFRGRPRPIPGGAGGSNPGRIIVVTFNCSIFKKSISWKEKYFDILPTKILNLSLKIWKLLPLFLTIFGFPPIWKHFGLDSLIFYCIEIELILDYFLNGFVKFWNEKIANARCR